MADVITLQILIIFNYSLNKGEVIRKKGKIIKIFKKVNKTDPKNYRSISLICILSKVVEKIVRENLIII